MHMRSSGNALLHALEMVWPDGVPDEEAENASRFSKPVQQMVLHRLEVIRRFLGEADGSRIDAAAAAQAAGVSVPRLYAMAAGWRKNRSVLELGGRVHAGRPRPPSIDPRVRQVVDREVAADRSVGVAAIARKLREEHPDCIVPDVSLKRLLLAALRELPPKDFGAVLVFDSAGLDALADGDRLRLFAVIDQGSGLVLGSAVATNHSRAWGHLWSAVDAQGRFDPSWLACFPPSSTDTRVDVRFQSSDVDGGSIVLERLHSAGIVAQGSFGGTGRAIVDAVGDKLGGLWLGVGERDDGVSYRNGRTARLPEYSQRMVESLEAGLNEHNERRRRALPPGASSERMEAVLQNVARVLEVVEGVQSDLEALPGYSEEQIA